MSAMYTTPWGTTEVPFEVMMWRDSVTSASTVAIGPVSEVEKINLVFDAKAPGVCSFTAPLNAQNAPLLDTRGGMLITVSPTGTDPTEDMRWEGVIVSAVARSGDSPEHAIVEVHAAGLASSAQDCTIFGQRELDPEKNTKMDGGYGIGFAGERPSDTVRIIAPRAMNRYGIPVYAGYGSMINFGDTSPEGWWIYSGDDAWDTMERLTAAGGFWLDWYATLPGETPWKYRVTGAYTDEGLPISSQRLNGLFVPTGWGATPRITWSVDAGDITEWSVEEHAPRAYRHHAFGVKRPRDGAETWTWGFSTSKADVHRWRRKGVAKVFDITDKTDAEWYRMRDGWRRAEAPAEYGPTMATKVVLRPGSRWKPGRALTHDRFWLGQMVELQFPHLDPIQRCVSSITVDWAHGSGVTITPELIEPNTVSTRYRDLYTGHHSLTRRVNRIENRNR